MPTIVGTIEAVSVKERKTQWGPKDATSFMLNGKWYSGGFKKWEVDKGDEVSLTYETNSKGYEDVTGIAVTAKAAPEAMTTKQTGAPRGGRAFPMDALDPGRVIVRQNALAHGTACALHNNAGGVVSPIEVIAFAREFEAYSCGDSDAAAAKEMFEDAGNPDPDA